MAATDFVTESAIDSLTTTIANAVKQNRVDVEAVGDGLTAMGNALNATTAKADNNESNINDLTTTVDGHTTTLTQQGSEIETNQNGIAALNTSVGTIGNLATTATNLVAAVNEVKSVADSAAGGGVAINDAATNATDAWSSNKIVTEIQAATAALISGAPETLNALNELAAAIDNDPNFATTMTTALGNRLRFDAAQTLTGVQQTQAWTNLGIAASSVDFAAAFTTAIA